MSQPRHHSPTKRDALRTVHLMAHLQRGAHAHLFLSPEQRLAMLALLDHFAQPVAAVTVCAFRTCKLAVHHLKVGVQGNPVGHRMPRARCRLCMAPKVLKSNMPERSRVRLLSRLLPLLRVLRQLPWLLLFSPL